MNKEKKNKIIMTIIIGGVCLILFAVMFMQFRTIEETDITAIENMREAELRTAISEWKGKYEETVEQLQANQKTIKDYKNKLEKNRINVTIRREMGRDIDGACGQLRKRYISHAER